MSQSTQQQETHQTQNKVVQDHSNANADAIHYEDGKIQKKQYGGTNVGEVQEIYVHLIEKTKLTVQTLIASVELGLTISQFCTLLSQKAKIAINNPEAKLKLQSQPIKQDTPFSGLLKAKSEQKAELFVFYDETKAIIKKKQTETKYEPILKYSFIDDKSKVKIYLQLQGIGKVPPQNISERYLEWSIEVKIHDYKGKNWIFAVPKTQCIIRPKQSKVIQKQNKLIISIAKNADADNWFSLYKQKCIGEKDD